MEEKGRNSEGFFLGMLPGKVEEMALELELGEEGIGMGEGCVGGFSGEEGGAEMRGAE